MDQIDHINDITLPEANDAAVQATASSGTSLPNGTTASTMAIPGSEISTDGASLSSVSKTEHLEPESLAMDQNPITTADPGEVHQDQGRPTTDPLPTVAESDAPSDYGHTYTEVPEPTAQVAPRTGTSPTGWLVPPAVNPTSRITFDGMLTTHLHCSFPERSR